MLDTANQITNLCPEPLTFSRVEQLSESFTLCSPDSAVLCTLNRLYEAFKVALVFTEKSSRYKRRFIIEKTRDVVTSDARNRYLGIKAVMSFVAGRVLDWLYASSKCIMYELLFWLDRMVILS